MLHRELGLDGFFWNGNDLGLKWQHTRTDSMAVFLAVLCIGIHVCMERRTKYLRPLVRVHAI